MAKTTGEDFLPWGLIGSIVDYLLQLLVQLAWPIVVIVAIFALRPQIAAMLDEVESLKFGSVEARFKRKVSDVTERLRRAEERRDARKGHGAPTYQKEDFLAMSPRATVLESWLRVEEKLREVARSRDIHAEPNVPTHRIIQNLRRRNTLSDGLVRLLDDLRKMRNEAVHVRRASISEDVASEYADSCARALNWIERRLPRTGLEGITLDPDETD